MKEIFNVFDSMKKSGLLQVFHFSQQSIELSIWSNLINLQLKMSQNQSITKIFKLGLTKNADWGPESDEVSYSKNYNDRSLSRKILISDNFQVFLDFIYYSRQIVGLIIGFLWGFFGITGFFGLAS